MERRYEDSALFRYVAHPPRLHSLKVQNLQSGRPSTKPLVQVKPRAPAGCKLVGMVKGTKLWAGECTEAPALRTGTPTEETSSTTVPDAAGGATKDQQ